MASIFKSKQVSLNLADNTYQLRSTKQLSAPLNIIQITDSHLFQDEKGKLLGLETQKSLEAVVRHIANNKTADIILATGDLAQDGSPEAYQRLGETLSELKVPVFWLPGNHDCMATMSLNLVHRHVYSKKRILFKNWQIILLDSSVEDQIYGKFTAKELDFLHCALEDKPSHFALVALHHQPVELGSKWLDSIGLKNSAEFFAVLARHNQVRGVVWGHVHQEFTRRIGAVQLFSTPSTSVQFEPGSTDFEAGLQHPGYRQLQLLAEGDINSEVIRTKPLDFTVDYSVKGY